MNQNMNFFCMNIFSDIATNCRLWWRAFFLFSLKQRSKVCYMSHRNFSALCTQFLSVSKLRMNFKYILSLTVTHNTHITQILKSELQALVHCKLLIITVNCTYVCYINLKKGLKLSHVRVYARECELSD